MDEIFRPIEGYEGLYEVSNLGKVRSIGYRKERILKPVIDIGGYSTVHLVKEGKLKWFKVHRLVAQAFIPNTEGLPQINHIDEDKTNNRVDNLEWCTGSYNIRYGTHNERMVQTKISNGNADPEMCGLTKDGDRKKYYRLRYQKNREKMRKYQREWARKYRLKKKQENKDNRPSDESLW